MVEEHRFGDVARGGKGRVDGGAGVRGAPSVDGVGGEVEEAVAVVQS